MDRIFKHIGLYDFWGIFCAGAVVLTMGLIPFVSCFINMSISINSFNYVLIYILLSYIVGLILHGVSILFIDYRISGFNISKATKDSFLCNYLKPWKYIYIINNKEITTETRKLGFSHCYNDLKINDLTEKIDKFHSIYGMSRSIATGFLMLIVSLHICNQFFLKIENILLYIVIYALLFLIFYARAKKYFYRWIEWTYIEYQAKENKQQ